MHVRTNTALTLLPEARCIALASCERIGKEFAGHSTVNHSASEYVRLGWFDHINTAESRFSLMKRAVFGALHFISEAHWPRRSITVGDKSGIVASNGQAERRTLQRRRSRRAARSCAKTHALNPAQAARTDWQQKQGEEKCQATRKS